MRARRILLDIAIATLVATAVLGALWIQRAQAGGVVGPPCNDAALRPKVAGGGLVTFNCGGPATILVTDTLTISQPTTLDGGGAAITLHGGNGTRLFDVSSGVTLTLRNITLTNAYSLGSDGGAIRSDGTLVLDHSTIQFSSTDINHSGGAIFSSGPVFITNSTLKGNHGGSAGAMFINAANAQAQVTNSRFEGNEAQNVTFGRGGGAIWVGALAQLSIVDSQFMSNTSTLFGGALSINQDATATVTTQNLLSRTTFIGNVVTVTLGASGGAIHSEGALNVNDVGFFRNEVGSVAGAGGAISANAGSLDVSASDFDGNRALGVGGALSIYVQASIVGSTFTRNSADNGGANFQTAFTPPLTISSSRFDNNHATNFGGALDLEGPATLTNVTVSGNSAEYAGGGIASGGTLTLSNSAVISNTSGKDGGGVVLYGGVITMTNVTVSGNAAAGDGGGIQLGQFAKAMELNNATITRNLADSDNSGAGDGGGIRIVSGIVSVRNSIIAGNFDTPDNAGGGTLKPDCSGTLVSRSYNLLGLNVGCGGLTNGVDGDKVGSIGHALDPLLAPLANNGGATPTHALLPGSPAFNAGNPLPPGSGGAACAATDQRSLRRPLGPFCDMGAYEAGSVLWLPFIRR